MVENSVNSLFLKEEQENEEERSKGNGHQGQIDAVFP